MVSDWGFFDSDSVISQPHTPPTPLRITLGRRRRAEMERDESTWEPPGGSWGTFRWIRGGQ